MTHENAVAIVGISLRFPGAATVDQYWDNLSGGIESVRRFDREQLRAAGIPDAVIDDVHYVPASGYVEGYANFDYPLFNMSKTEAEYADIQSRQYLQCSYHALEDACIDTERFEGNVGVFGGTGAPMYLIENLLALRNTVSATEMFQMLFANEKEYLVTNTAYRLNLKGPALSVQSACSTSLVAVHYACQSLLNGECDAALAGGSSFGVPAEAGYLAYEGMILSPDGHCRPFDAHASGTVPGNGCGVVVLKRLEDALAHNDTIYGVIRGSAVNNDGSEKAGFTAPGVNGQVAVIHEALAVADIEPASVGYLEAHGTGTRLGDPVEFAALHQTYGLNRESAQTLYVGSVKSNFGHLNAAAGIAGLIKAILVLRHKMVPPTLHFHSPNPDLHIEDSAFRINTECMPWESNERRLAAVSSFGLGGTNSHLILSEWESLPEERARAARGSFLIPFSANTEKSLSNQIVEQTRFCHTRKPDWADYAHCMATGRKQHPQRSFVTVGGETCNLQPAQCASVVKAQSRPRAVFLFSDEAVPAAGCCRELYHSFEPFKYEIDSCLQWFAARHGGILSSYLLDSSSSLELEGTALDVARFALFRAMAGVLEDVGITPVLLGGQGVGEYAAASVAGMFTREEALTLVAEQAACVPNEFQGSMLVVDSAHKNAKPFLDQCCAELQNRIHIAHNSSGFWMVQGVPTDIDACARMLAAQGINAQSYEIPLDSQKSPAITHLTKVLTDIPCRQSERYFASKSIMKPRDWVERQMSPQGFFEMVGSDSRNSPATTYLVCGNHTASAALVSSIVKQHGAHDVVAVNVSSADMTHRSMLEAIGRLWQQGHGVDWVSINGGGKKMVAPGYVFDTHYCWKTPPVHAIEKPAVRVNSELYTPQWNEYKAARNGCQHKGVMVFDDSDGSLTQRLNALGLKTVTIVPSLNMEHDAWLTVDTDDEMGFVKLLENHRTLLQGCTLLVYGWSREKGGVAQHFEIPARLVAALDKTGSPINQMIMLTSGVFDVMGGETLSPLNLLLRGVLNAIPYEYPKLNWTLLELPHACEISERVLSDILSQNGGYQLLALRGRKIWQRRYHMLDCESGTSLVRQGDTILVTGGLGAVGLLFARFLLAQKVGTLVLTCRRPFPRRQQWDSNAGDERQNAIVEQLKELESEFNARILTFSVPVQNQQQMQQLINQIEHQCGNIDGIVHAAGLVKVSAMKPLSQVGIEDITNHLAPKLNGAQTLGKVTYACAPRFLMQVSSLSAEIGGYGFAAYGAANASLDSMECLVSPQTSVVTAKFNGFPSPGGGTRDADNSMSADELNAVLLKVFADSGTRQIIVSRGMPALIPAIRNETRHASHSESISEKTPTVENESVEAFVLHSVAELVGTASVGLQDDLFEIGGDSLAAAQLNARIVERFGIDLPIDEILNNPCPAVVCRAIEERLHAQQSAEELPEELLTQIESMSDEEAAELLKRLNDECCE